MSCSQGEKVLNDADCDAVEAAPFLLAVLERRGIVGRTRHEESDASVVRGRLLLQSNLALGDSRAQPRRDNEAVTLAAHVQQNRIALDPFDTRISVLFADDEILNRVQQSPSVELITRCFQSNHHSTLTF